MRHSERLNMKNSMALTTLLFVMASAQAFGFQDEHSSIYTKKIVQIVNAMNVGDFSTEQDFQSMLQTACERNQCNSTEKKSIQLLGQEVIHCKIKHLKSHGIQNADARSICESKQSMLGCDTLATPLLRKMCYTGNSYNTQVLKMKEVKMKNRQPASAPSK
jgi:hypothetical protein